MNLAWRENFKKQPIEKIKTAEDEVSAFWADSLLFEDSLQFQDRLKEGAAQNKSPISLLGFESSNPVISLGLRADSSHILWPPDRLKKHNISQVRVKRGGSATLHAPGQLVIYPVARLPALGLKVRDFIALLQTVTRDVLKDLGIFAGAGPSAGLWTQRGKIAFFGIHVSQGVSCHGLSVNVENDLGLFSALKSCGQRGRSHDKLSFYPQTRGIKPQKVFLKWRQKALKAFSL